MKPELKSYLQENGWNTENLYDLIEVLDKLRDLRYEIENCCRGCYTGALTYAQLETKVKNLAVELKESFDCVWSEKLDEDDEREFEEEQREEEEDDTEEDED